MSAPKGKIPFSTFHGLVRQVNVGSLNDLARRAMEFAFPGFLTHDEPTRKQLEGMRRMLERGVDYATWQNRPKRRFSGGDELPSGRYYTTLAVTPEGHDQGTLMRELLAYCIPNISGILVVADLADDEAIEFLGPPWKKDACYVLSFLDKPDHRSPLIRFLEEKRLLQAAFGHDKSNGGRYLVPIPYKNAQITIDKTIDLRLPNVQQWFFNTFAVKDTEYLLKPDRAGATCFADLIPALLASEHGGNHFTESVGLWMLMNSANALVFPSARSNCGITIRDGALVNWHGWNLIDYRGAPTPRSQQFVDLSSGWPKKLGQNVTIRVATDPPYAGSWKVSGLEEWYEHVLDEQQKEAYFDGSRELGRSSEASPL